MRIWISFPDVGWHFVVTTADGGSITRATGQKPTGNANTQPPRQQTKCEAIELVLKKQMDDF